ncbi:MAG: AAA family ATPase, partial [Lachnospiraceae bacterium]|nr:AAA family ATPase [Lachnospiraceae bacterium]
MNGKAGRKERSHGSERNEEKLPVGIENFAELRKEGFYFVDKTGMIRDLLNSWGKVNLFTRP